MEFRAIRRLLAVVEHGSVSVAAKRLNISQPALTRSIQQLEFLYGAKLIERTAQGTKLTHVGKALEPAFRQILESRERIKSEIKNFQSARKWNSTFGICVSFEGMALPMVLAELRERCPTMDMHIYSGLTSVLVDRIAMGEIEFALGLRVPGGKVRHQDIHFEQIVSDRLIIAACPQHPFARRETVPLAMLSSASWILPRLTGFGLQSLRDIFTSQGLPGPQHVITLDSIVQAKSALTCSDLITIVSELSIQNEIARGDVVVINAPDFLAQTSAGLYYRKNAIFSELGTWSMEALRKGIKEASSAIIKRKRRGEEE